MMETPGNFARCSFGEVEAEGPPARPLDFPPPVVRRAFRGNALVIYPSNGVRDIIPNVIHREDLQNSDAIAYLPQRRLQDAIFGSVWVCLVLRRHIGVAADDAATAAGMEPGNPAAPIVWEVCGSYVAIKMVEWAIVHRLRGRVRIEVKYLNSSMLPFVIKFVLIFPDFLTLLFYWVGITVAGRSGKGSCSDTINRD